MYSQPLRGIGDCNVGGAESATYTEACGVLQHTSRDELEKLMNDNDAFDAFVDGLAPVKKLGTDKEAIMVSNVSLSEYNLSLEPRLISSREDLAQRYNKLIELQKNCERVVLQVESSAVNSSPETSLALLQAELAKAEEESEKVADNFSEAGRSANVELFLSQYVSLRSLAHIRRVKMEKLTEMLRNNNRSNMTASSAAAPPVSTRPVAHAYSSGPPPPVATQNLNAHPPYPVHSAANGWQPYPQPYPGAMNSYHPAPPLASYMPR